MSLIFPLRVCNHAVLYEIIVGRVVLFEHQLDGVMVLIYIVNRLDIDKSDYFSDIKEIFILINDVIEARETHQRLRILIVFHRLVCVLAVHGLQLGVRVHFLICLR